MKTVRDSLLCLCALAVAAGCANGKAVPPGPPQPGAPAAAQQTSDVAGIVARIAVGSPTLVQDAAAIQRSGDARARADTERHLIAMARSIGDVSWRESQRAAIEMANKRRRL